MKSEKTLKAIRNIAIISWFVCALALPVLKISWTGGEESEREKRCLAPFPMLYQDGRVNPSLYSETVAWLEDHIGLRGQMVELVGTLELNVMHQSPSESVHIGEEGWYYYTQQGNIELATGEYELTGEMLAQFLDQLLMARDILRDRGAEFVVVLPPSKATVYPEYLHVESEIVPVTPADIFADYIEANSDLKVVRLKQTLIEAKEDVQVYAKTDTHWNDTGAYTATEKILQQLRGYGLGDETSASFEESTKAEIGDLTSMMGMTVPEQGPSISLVNARSRYEDSSSAEFSDIYAAAGRSECSVYSNSSVDAGKVLMFGDSFYGLFPFAQQMLAEAFSEFVLIRNATMHENVVEAVDPDLVLWEVTERKLIELSTTPFVDMHRYQSVNEIHRIVGITAERLQNGELKVVVEDAYDPQIIYAPLSAPGNYSKIIIRLDYASQEEDFQLFFAGENGAFSAERSVYFHVTPGQTLYQIPVDKFPGIQYIRMDFPNVAGAEYRIGSIRLG